MAKPRPKTVRLRLVVVELDAEFSDEEAPSLPGQPVADDTDQSRPLAKCEGFPWRKAGGAK